MNSAVFTLFNSSLRWRRQCLTLPPTEKIIISCWHRRSITLGRNWRTGRNSRKVCYSETFGFMYFIEFLFLLAGQVNGDPNMPPVSGNISNFFTSPPQPVQQPQQPGQMQQTPTQQMVRQQHGGTPPSSASSSGYQGSSTSSTLNTDPLLQGGGLPSANMEIKMEVKEEPPNSTSISMTNSPVPMLSSPINPPQSVPQSTSQPASQTGQMTVGKQPGALPPSSSSSSSSCGQNADPLLQGGGLSSLPSIKTEIKEEPLPSIGAPMTNSPHPPSSLENPRSSGLPSAIPSPLSVSKKVISPSSQLQQDSTQTRVENRKIIADPSLKKGIILNDVMVLCEPLFEYCTVFTKEELMAALMPVFVAVYNQDPESFPFRQPVDPKALGIPVSVGYTSYNNSMGIISVLTLITNVSTCTVCCCCCFISEFSLHMLGSVTCWAVNIIFFVSRIILTSSRIQ